MDNTLIVIVFLLYIICWTVGPQISNKFKIRKRIYLNTSYTKYKSKYLGYIILAITLLAIIIKNGALFTQAGYYDLMVLMIGVLLGLTLILRNDVFNQKYVNKNDKKDNIYFLDFTKSSFISFAIMIVIINFLSTQSNVLLNIIVMVILLLELIIFVLSLCPDRIYEYFTINKYSFSYVLYYYLIIVLSLIPPILLMIIVFLLTLI